MNDCHCHWHCAQTEFNSIGFFLGTDFPLGLSLGALLCGDDDCQIPKSLLYR